MALFTCAHCGHSVEADQLMGGGTPICPQCHNALIFAEGPPLLPPSSAPPPLPASVLPPPPPMGPPPPIVPTSASTASAPPPLRHRSRHRERHSNAGLISIVLSAVLLLTCGYVIYVKMHRDNERSRKEMLALMDQAQQVARDAAVHPDQPIDPATLPQTTRPAANDQDRMMKLQQEAMQELAAVHNDFIKKINDAGYNSLLDVDRLAADEGFKETHAVLEKVDQIMKENRAKAQAVIESFPKRAEALPMTDSEMKRGFLEGMRASIARIAPIVTKVWDLQEQVNAQCAELLKFLEENRGQWSPKEHHFVFRTQAQVDVFKAHMDKITALNAEQKVVRRGAIDAAIQRVDKVKENFK